MSVPFVIRKPPVHRAPRPRASAPAVRPATAAAVHVVGMHGLGDNIHQRAIVRELMQRGMVELETPWPSAYHDLVGPRLRLVNKASALRTQAKNAVREKDKYAAPVPGLRQMRVWYRRDDVLREGSILGGMCSSAHVSERDFSMPIPNAWKRQAQQLVPGWDNGKPLLVYRPLVMRTEWGGCASRNPEIDTYHEIFSAIRNYFYVVSVADLVPNVEWVVSRPVAADLEFHRGELTFEALAALMQRAALSFASPGFATIMAQAVGTPSVCVFGGHESAMTISGGAHLAPTLGIDPIVPCNCFTNKHACQKAIDVPKAVAQLLTFVEKYVHVDSDDARQPGPYQLELPL